MIIATWAAASPWPITYTGSSTNMYASQCGDSSGAPCPSAAGAGSGRLSEKPVASTTRSERISAPVVESRNRSSSVRSTSVTKPRSNVPPYDCTCSRPVARNSLPEVSSVTPITLCVSAIIAARPPPRSISTVSWPSRAPYRAVVRPAGPPPTTAISYSSSDELITRCTRRGGLNEVVLCARRGQPGTCCVRNLSRVPGSHLLIPRPGSLLGIVACAVAVPSRLAVAVVLLLVGAAADIASTYVAISGGRYVEGSPVGAAFIAAFGLVSSPEWCSPRPPGWPSSGCPSRSRAGPADSSRR